MASSTSPRLASAHRDAVVLTVLITAVMLLIWNGSAFFHNLRIGGEQFGPEIRLASTALTLNVAHVDVPSGEKRPLKVLKNRQLAPLCRSSARGRDAGRA